MKKLLLYRMVQIMYNRDLQSWEASFMNVPIIGDAEFDEKKVQLPFKKESATDLELLAVALKMLPDDEWFMVFSGSGGHFYTRDGDIINKGIGYEEVQVTIRRPVSYRKKKRLYYYDFPVKTEDELDAEWEAAKKEAEEKRERRAQKKQAVVKVDEPKTVKKTRKQSNPQ